MNLKTSHFILSLLAAILIGFFVGRNFSSNPNNQTSNAISSPIGKTTAAKTDEATTESSDESVDSTSSDIVQKPDVEVPDKLEKPKNPAVTSGAANKSILERVKMGISDDKISQVLTSIAKNLEAKNLKYDASKSQDCSGIYHQIKDSIQVRLPALRQGSEYQYPRYNSDRSSRRIADWYHRNNNLLIVDDPIASKNSIRPGTVLFFGRSRKGIKKLSIEDLTDRDNSFTSNGIIMHVAVVTQVFTDDNGNVTGYDMMHGRNSETPASRSGSKEKQSSSTPGLPPFGNWSQHWVAAANIATRK
jgi:uncharacterized protein YneF (UPF0154 family)